MHSSACFPRSRRFVYLPSFSPARLSVESPAGVTEHRQRVPPSAHAPRLVLAERRRPPATSIPSRFIPPILPPEGSIGRMPRCGLVSQNGGIQRIQRCPVVRGIPETGLRIVVRRNHQRWGSSDTHTLRPIAEGRGRCASCWTPCRGSSSRRNCTGCPPSARASSLGLTPLLPHGYMSAALTVTCAGTANANLPAFGRARDRNIGSLRDSSPDGLGEAVGGRFHRVVEVVAMRDRVRQVGERHEVASITLFPESCRVSEFRRRPSNSSTFSKILLDNFPSAGRARSGTKSETPLGTTHPRPEGLLRPG